MSIRSRQTLDPGTANQVQKRTAQQLDQFGNVTSTSLYDFGAVTKAYTNAYLSDASGGHPAGSNYNAQHIHNRLLTSTVTQGSQTATLVSNTYDTYSFDCTVTIPGYSYVDAS